ncbi:Zinc finger CCCH domain-containing protein 41 [Sesamum angolense]|uniref:Zinc finger CCCH domain-containing protein 41 n=1 Tax=Sesamum angolense TaxID=2727404 RepID=A0AAE1WGK2_9LAMI|nr:Zinc finger CCCH domain-containing protein 41 [Sesamum angolense]
MELKVSSEKPGFSSSDCGSDPDEKEISEGEDEDDDRNHKHRRREARSQSMEGNSIDQGLARPYRKRNRPFENGYSYREGDPQSGETWKNYNIASERDFSRFEKRRSYQASYSRAPLELNQRIRVNQTLSGEVGPVRGRGRDPISWGIRDSRLGLVDVASQIAQPGPVPSALFGRGLPMPNMSNAPSTSWNAFGLVPGVPNGGLDSLHPLGLQGALRPAISPPMNIGIPRQRCRDFEERGFCLRGDMCPMEHGVNRIVIEDVQSLSQFNLPVSLPGSQLMGTSSGQGALPVVNSKAFHAKSSKSGMTEDGSALNGGVMGGSVAGASDVYDPDQPLWTNDNPETSAALLALNQSNADETEAFLDMDPSDRQNIESYEGFNDERPLRNASTAGSQSSSVWGRIGSSKRGSGVKEKIDSVATPSSYLERNINGEEARKTSLPNVTDQGKWTNADGNGPLLKESSLKPHGDSVRNIRKPSQKALRTLFVNGIPLKDNKREALLSHFQKFGEVIDIYIPMHSERAFVQFSKREEAESALRAPDAVMGNRFIKLWWANRDNIPDDGISGTSNVPITPRGVTVKPALPHSFVLDKGKETPHPAGVKDGNAHGAVTQVPVYEHPKPMVANGPKAPPPQQKKLESLELLKEELRKKQEMLEQKRNEFRRQLDKLEKQAVGSKDGTVSDLTTRRSKGEIPPDHAKAETSKSSPRDAITTENDTSAEHAVPHASTSNASVPVREPLKPSLRPLAAAGPPFTVNRFKLDNRPTAFRILSPLPTGLANVAALEEHFSTYGDLSSVEMEESKLQETNDASVPSDISARISFTTRRFAEKAFLHGKCWQGHKLQFMWLSSTSSGKEGAAAAGNLSSSSNMTSDAKVQPTGEDASTPSQKISGKEGASSGNLSSSSNKILDSNVQPSGEDVSTHLQEIAASETGEPDHPATEVDADSTEQDKDAKSISTSF